MATCQYRPGPDHRGLYGPPCDRPARWLCMLQATYNAGRGHVEPHMEYRCDQHKDGEAVRTRGTA